VQERERERRDMSFKYLECIFSDADDEDSTKDILPMDPPVAASSVEFKRGYLVRKCTFEFGGKKSKSNVKIIQCLGIVLIA
jgi:hypothetical protein